MLSCSRPCYVTNDRLEVVQKISAAYVNTKPSTGVSPLILSKSNLCETVPVEYTSRLFVVTFGWRAPCTMAASSFQIRVAS